MCAAADTSVYGESDPCQMETQIQFENGEPQPFMIEHYMVDSTVAQVKATILRMQILKNVPEQPNCLVLCALMPRDIEVGEGNISFGAPTEMDLDDTRSLQSYLDEISCCVGLKLKRRVVS